jgi:hydroxymethylbilane synthase
MEKIRLIGRGSRLSVLQLKKVQQLIEINFPAIQVEIIIRNSKGDALQNIPLHTVEGSDFFTQDIFEALTTGEADIAVHSLKDMSSEHFFGPNHFAVIDRDDVRDIAIFSADIIEKLQQGKCITVGTCSPRREEMALTFLQKALPQVGNFSIEPQPIRGNVDTRLRKLDTGEYDAIILATAGLNRLLSNDDEAQLVRALLQNKRLMLLPLIECVPAPCQGAIVAETVGSNTKAVEILKAINKKAVYDDCVAEKKEAIKYGKGCLQKFGVATINTRHINLLYAAGTNAAGDAFEKWQSVPSLVIADDTLFTSTAHMKDFFQYDWKQSLPEISVPVVFIANHKAIRTENEIQYLQNKKVIAAGTRTWVELAKKGFWISASADGLGFEFLLPALQMPLFKISSTDICIITHQEAAVRWQQKGYAAVSNYQLKSGNNKTIAEAIAKATAIFWSSFAQYQFYGSYSKENVIHICPGGETAALLKQQGIEPVIFPTIKSFEQWRTSSIRPHSVA